MQNWYAMCSVLIVHSNIQQTFLDNYFVPDIVALAWDIKAKLMILFLMRNPSSLAYFDITVCAKAEVGESEAWPRNCK